MRDVRAGEALRARLSEDVACPSCGYNLRGVGTVACPECGRIIPLPVGETRRDALGSWRPVSVVLGGGALVGVLVAGWLFFGVVTSSKAGRPLWTVMGVAPALVPGVLRWWWHRQKGVWASLDETDRRVRRRLALIVMVVSLVLAVLAL